MIYKTPMNPLVKILNKYISSMNTNTDQINCRMSTEYDERLYEMLKSFQERLRIASGKHSENIYSFMYPSWGDIFSDGTKLLIYGNCSGGPCEPTFGINDGIDRSIIEKGYAFSNTDDSNPAGISWTDESVVRSFCWNVCREVTKKIHGIENCENSLEWYRYPAFSSLFKIGNVKGYRPKQDEYEAQKDFAVELFLRELDEIKPDIVLMLTGLDYADDFIGALGLKPNMEGKRYVLISEKVNQTKIIMTRFFKVGIHEKCVNEIMECLNLL